MTGCWGKGKGKYVTGGGKGKRVKGRRKGEREQSRGGRKKRGSSVKGNMDTWAVGNGEEQQGSEEGGRDNEAERKREGVAVRVFSIIHRNLLLLDRGVKCRYL